MFTPSIAQTNIFTAWDALNPGGVLQIKAVAGSGKSTTLEQLIARMSEYDRESTLLCAFGREIKQALEARVRRNGWNCTVKTLHGIGWACLNRFYSVKGGERWNAQCDGSTKYRRLIEIYFINRGRDVNDKPGEAEEAMFDLVNMVRITLTDWASKEAVYNMAISRGLDIPDIDIMFPALQAVLNWGINGLKEPDSKGYTYHPKEWIDYTDQLWLPHVFDLTPYQFRHVMVDECQDLNRAQLELILRAVRRGGKMIFVGDPNQAIFAFAGANSKSFHEITVRLNAVVMPLDVCYRCPKEVVAFAKLIVPEMEAAPNAKMGIVQPVYEAFFFANVNPLDMVLCRTTAPLVSMFFQLIKEGKRAKVKGRDFSKQLTKIVEQIGKHEGFSIEKFVEFATIWRNNQLRAIENKDNADALRESICDRSDCVIAIYEGVKAMNRVTINSISDLRGHIENMFADNSEEGVILLSTIHRAKGLEAAIVYLLCPELIPHPMAKTEDSLEQETNLKYVAYTRAMEALYIVDTTGKYLRA